jgi:hypothetical protein
MKRSCFIAFTAAALSVSRPPLPKFEDLTKRETPRTNLEAAGWTKPMWLCGSAVVWLDIPSGIYYRAGERWYGRTEHGAYTCENVAISVGNHGNLI